MIDHPRPGRELAAVLFDMDGTLVDTEPHWIASEYDLVGRFGGRWSDEHAHALVGNALLDSARYLRDVGGVELELPVIVEEMTDQVQRAIRVTMPWRPGALELLEECRTAGVPTALVTMSYTRLAAELVAAAPEDAFTTVVTGDQVSRGKPDPEPYLTACSRLGVDPADTVAIEDSPTGLASAQSAGCVTVAVPHRVPIAPAAGRTIVDSLTDLSLAGLRTLMRTPDGAAGTRAAP